MFEEVSGAFMALICFCFKGVGECKRVHLRFKGVGGVWAVQRSPFVRFQGVGGVWMANV